jgi:hypothetical protein
VEDDWAVVSTTLTATIPLFSVVLVEWGRKTTPEFAVPQMPLSPKFCCRHDCNPFF